MSYSFTAPRKDPAAVLDYKMIWSKRLSDGETIADQEITATTGLTVRLARILDDGQSVAWRLYCGDADSDHFVTVTITTTARQRDQRTIRVPVRER